MGKREKEKEDYNEIVLTETILSDDRNTEFKGLFLPKDSYMIFIKNNGKYEKLLEIPIAKGIGDPEKVIRYYEDNISNQDQKTVADSLLNNGANELAENLNIDTGTAKEVLEDILTQISNTMEYDIQYRDDRLDKSEVEHTTTKQIHNLTDNEKIIHETIYNYHNKRDDIEIVELHDRLVNAITNQISLRKIRTLLHQYLTKKYKIILRKNVGGMYQLDPIANGYCYKTHDDIITLLKEDFGADLISDEDLKIAITYIGDRLEPQYNIVKFPNCIYDMESMEIIEPEDPVFTLIESQYNYNPNAESTILKEFLYSSLARETEEETEEVVKGLKQIVGYFFTSGNRLNVIPILTGVAGGGKSVFTNILTSIFGSNKIADVSFQEMENNTHGTSALANKHLNFIRDSDDRIIETNSFFNKIMGYDDIPCNPKFKDPYMLPKDEVPKTMLICNNIPKFRDYKQAMIERMLVIEFMVKFRGTDKQDPELEKKILDNPEEIEWLIYESLEAYKEIHTQKDFILKLDENQTRELVNKHTNPINFLLQKVILKHDVEASESDIDFNTYTYVVTDELLEIIIGLSKDYGVDVPLGTNSRKDKYKLLRAIKDEYDLHDGEFYIGNDGKEYNRQYKTQTHRLNGDIKRIYPNLIVTDLYKEKLENLNTNDD